MIIHERYQNDHDDVEDTHIAETAKEVEVKEVEVEEREDITKDKIEIKLSKRNRLNIKEYDESINHSNQESRLITSNEEERRGKQSK